MSTFVTARGESPKTIHVTADNFIRAETDRAMGGEIAQNQSFGKFAHRREPIGLDQQVVPRVNRDTLYSSAVSRPRRRAGGDHHAGRRQALHVADHHRRGPLRPRRHVRRRQAPSRQAGDWDAVCLRGDPQRSPIRVTRRISKPLINFKTRSGRHNPAARGRLKSCRGIRKISRRCAARSTNSAKR